MIFGQTFNTCRDYLSFFFAKEFRDSTTLEKIDTQSKAEVLSQYILSPIQYPIDKLLQNINQPVVIVALNVIGVAATILFFYPDSTSKAIQIVSSPFVHIESWILKFSAYMASNTIISALSVRALARMEYGLFEDLRNRKIISIHLGTRVN